MRYHITDKQFLEIKEANIENYELLHGLTVNMLWHYIGVYYHNTLFDWFFADNTPFTTVINIDKRINVNRQNNYYT